MINNIIIFNKMNSYKMIFDRLKQSKRRFPLDPLKK